MVGLNPGLNRGAFPGVENDAQKSIILEMLSKYTPANYDVCVREKLKYDLGGMTMRVFGAIAD